VSPPVRPTRAVIDLARTDQAFAVASAVSLVLPMAILVDLLIDLAEALIPPEEQP
jgi:hypothetical protein